MEITLWHSVDIKSNNTRNVKVTQNTGGPIRNTHFIIQSFTPSWVKSQGETQRQQVDESTIPPFILLISHIGAMEVHNTFLLNEQRRRYNVTPFM